MKTAGKHKRTLMAAPRNRGFTLLEILVAITILAVIVAIVYASFSSVAATTEEARIAADELRLRQFLSRQFEINFASVYTDIAYALPPFEGASETGIDGPMDSVTFCSLSPLMGGLAPPGLPKQVTYAATQGNDSSMELGSFDTEVDENPCHLEASETIVTASSVNPLDNTDDPFGKEPSVQFADVGSPGWSVPISSLDFSYFSGTEWVEEWNSDAEGRLPWAIRIRINFAKTKEEKEAESAERFDPAVDADFEMVIPIPMGAASFTYPEDWPELFTAGGQAPVDTGAVPRDQRPSRKTPAQQDKNK